VYGINVSSKEPPHLRGCFAEEIVLFPHTSIYKLDKNADPAALVSASCSGATAAHSVEEAGVKSGDTIVVIGPGPLGLWTAALAKSAGAITVILTGTRHDRLELGKLFGADLTVNVRETTESERLSAIKEASGGFGVDKVIDTSGAAGAVTEAFSWLRPGGTYANSGVAVPADHAPIDLYDLNKRNLTMKGVWVSGTRHFLRAVKLAVENAFPFEKMVSHRLPLARAQEALNMGRAEGVMKVVLVP
jgi:threonine dehydrogenase-like Zn-dependent dehydrogenase